MSCMPIWPMPIGPPTATLMDIYVPEGVENPPIVVRIHGGWVPGRRQVEPRRAGQVHAVRASRVRLDQLPAVGSGGLARCNIDDLMDAFAFVRRKWRCAGL